MLKSLQMAAVSYKGDFSLPVVQNHVVLAEMQPSGIAFIFHGLVPGSNRPSIQQK